MFFDLASALATIGPPTELMTSEVTARSFMVNWTHAPGKVEKYRVVYYPTRGGKPEEVIRRRCFQTIYSQALRFCTVVKIRQKWMYKEIILSQAFTVVGLNTFPCVQVVLMSRAYGIYVSSYFHQRTCRTGHESISNTTHTDLTFFFFLI